MCDPFGRGVQKPGGVDRKRKVIPADCITCGRVNGIGSSRTNPTVKSEGRFGSAGGRFLRPQLIQGDYIQATRKNGRRSSGTVGRHIRLMVIPSPGPG